MTDLLGYNEDFASRIQRPFDIWNETMMGNVTLVNAGTDSGPNKMRTCHANDEQYTDERSLSLVGNSYGLAIIPHGHARSGLFRTDGPSLVRILDKGNSFAPWNQANFPEAFEPSKYIREAFLVGGVRQVAQEQDLVRWEVFVRDNRCCCARRRFEAGAFGGLRWSRSFWSSRRAFESLLRFECLLCLFAF